MEMKSFFDIIERSIFCDRIQVSSSINYLGSDELSMDELSYNNSVLACYLQDRKGFNVKFDSVRSQYYIEVPEDFYKLKYPYFSHVRLRLDNPYTITSEFNFIRYLRASALYCDVDNEGFPIANEYYDKVYDLSIRVADDNYIDGKVWKKWDSYFIRGLVDSIPQKIKDFSGFIINGYIDAFDRPYNILTVKQIEFNQDYFVGHHKSSDVLHQLMYFVISSSGVEWINNLSGIGVSVYKTESVDNSGTRFYGDLYNPTLKFKVGKGVFFKIYRKTTDHIRFEVTFQKEYIKHKFGKESFDFVYPRLRDIAKSFFKKADFVGIIHSAIDNSYSDNFSLLDNLYSLLDEIYPYFSSVADAVISKNPITDPDVIRYVHSNRNLHGLFVSKYVDSGKKVLVYNPALARQKRLEHRKQLFESDEKKQFMHRLWRDLKVSNPDSDIFVMNGLNGFKWRKNDFF